jgi:hypothetical protein
MKSHQLEFYYSSDFWQVLKSMMKETHRNRLATDREVVCRDANNTFERRCSACPIRHIRIPDYNKHPLPKEGLCIARTS